MRHRRLAASWYECQGMGEVRMRRDRGGDDDRSAAPLLHVPRRA